jgi:hypothetical protein
MHGTNGFVYETDLLKRLSVSITKLGVLILLVYIVMTVINTIVVLLDIIHRVYIQ